MISTNSKSLFSLNTKTGAISVASSLMSKAGRTYNMVISARDNPGEVIFNIAKRNITVIFRIEEASVDVLCVSLINKLVMQAKSELFRRYC